MDNKPLPPEEKDYHQQTLFDKMKDEEDQDEFRRFLDDVSPAELIRHLKEKDQNNEPPFDRPNTDAKTQR